MYKEKGFTLVELLAVIIILAVIVLITSPLVMNVINYVKVKSNENTYKTIERGAKFYIIDEYNSNIKDEMLISVSDLSAYVKNIPEEAKDKYIYVRNIGGKLTYYYTGRNNNSNNQLLKYLIENQTGIIKKSTKVNGRIVDKIIGSRDNKDSLKNHVWYSGYLWQVIELNDDGIKMVMNYPVSSISFGKTTDYKTSYVRKWLNTGGVFYDKLIRKDLLTDTIMCLDDMKDVVTESIEMTNGLIYNALKSATPINNCETSISDKVGLLTLEDYAYAYDGTLNQYQHNGTMKESSQNKKGGFMGYNFIDTRDMVWLLTPSNLNNYMWVTRQYNPSYVSSEEGNVSGAKGVKPVITLKNTVMIKNGIGTTNDPYVVDTGYELDSDTDLIEAVIGEFVYINEVNNPYETNKSVKEKVRYRIIDLDEKGIKLEREDVLRKLPDNIAYRSNANLPFYSYYDENVNSDLWCYYDDVNAKDYTKGCNNNNYMKNIGVGNYELYKGNSVAYFLNEADNSFYSWIDNKYKKIIKNNDWFLRTSNGDLDVSDFRKINKNNNNGKNYPNSNYDGIYTAKITLPSYGDILSGNDLGTSYWYQNRWTNSNTNTGFSNGNGSSGSYSTTGSKYSFAIRPVFYIDNDIKILSGNGTKNNPYQLKV